MEALILSCGTGGGHDSAARALEEAWTGRGHTACVCNPYTWKSVRLARNIDRSYIALVRRFPGVFGAVYHLGDIWRRLPGRSPIYRVNRRMTDLMEIRLREQPVDVIFTTHLFPALMLTALKEQDVSLPPTVFVATDYTCIPFAEETDCDAWVIPEVDLLPEFAARGMPENRIYPLGIPTGSAFAAPVMPCQAKTMLGLDPKTDYALICAGSMGGGRMARILDALLPLPQPFQAVVVCGSNRTLYKKLQSQHMPGTIVVGETRQMALYMKACRLFITKPGGLSSTEAAVCGIPMVHTGGIPGCETHNEIWFNRKGMSIVETSPQELATGVHRLLTDEKAAADMVRRQRIYTKPTAAADICALGERLAADRQYSMLL